MFLPSSVRSIALSSACIRKLAIIFASEVLQMQQITSWSSHIKEEAFKGIFQTSSMTFKTWRWKKNKVGDIW
jgi:hypothetical protein